MFVNRSKQNEQSLYQILHRWVLPSFGSFGEAVSEENVFLRNRPIRKRNRLWRPWLLPNRDKMCNLYREYSIDASYQVLVYLTKVVSEEKIFKNQPIKNKNCLWQPCLLMDRDEKCYLYRWSSIDASYQVSVHLVLEEIKMWKVNVRRTTDNGWWAKNYHVFKSSKTLIIKVDRNNFWNWIDVL